MQLDAALDELYGLRPEEFTAARDRLSSEARSAGDRDLAASIKKLKRPSVGAWLINQLVRRRAEEVERLLDVAARLRDAHARLDGAELRALSQQRQQLIPALLQAARAVAEDAGQRVSAGAVREVQETLEAAVADPDAASALRSGRLSAALSYSGLGVGGDAAGAPSSGFPSSGAPSADAVSPGAERAAKEAEAARAAARRRVSEAESELNDAEAELARTRRLVEDLRVQLSDLEVRARRCEERIPGLRAELDTARAHEQRAEAKAGR